MQARRLQSKGFEFSKKLVKQEHFSHIYIYIYIYIYIFVCV